MEKVELWRPWPKNNDYLVSNTGKVLGYTRFQTSRRTLIPDIGKLGYACQHVLVNGKRVHVGVHKMVAETFIPNPKNLSDVHHIDENKLNDNVDNLAWVTHRDNCNIGTINQRRSATAKRIWSNRKALEG